MKRILTLIILVISCAKVIKNIEIKNKDINDDLVLAINNSEIGKAIELIEKGANINYLSNNKTVLEIAIDKCNLPIIKILLEKEVELTKDNITKIYDLVLNDLNQFLAIDIINLIKDKHNLEEGLISRSKYFSLLCYTSNAENVKRFIETNNINLKEVKVSREPLNIACIGGKIDIVNFLIKQHESDTDFRKKLNNLLSDTSRYGHKEIIQLLIEKGANINDNYYHFGTALMKASESGHKEVVELLLEKGANINCIDKYGNTALLLAAQRGHEEVASLLIKRGAYINDKNENENTALMSAADFGYKNLVKLMLESGANVNERNIYGWTALKYAIGTGCKEIVELLIEKGADINDIDKHDHTALMVASEKGYKEIVKLLLKKGAKIDNNFNNNCKALLLASRYGHKEVVRLLIEKGNYINIKCYNGPVLMLAAEYGHKEIAELMLEKDTNINYKDENKNTALMKASEKGHKEIVKLLLEKGANINDIDKYSNTALIKASGSGYKEVVELLLEKGVNINDIDKYGNTALIKASGSGHKEVVELLLEKGVNINDKNNYEDTALMLSSKFGHEEVVKLLLEKGANINDKNKQKQTALMIASHFARERVVSLLIEKGADVSDAKSTVIENTLIENIKNNKESSLLIIDSYRNKVDFEYKNQEGNTLLHYAALSNNLTLFTVIFSENKNLNLLNQKGESILYYALSSDNINQDFIWYLINQGASLQPSSYVKDKLLLDILLPYEGLFNKLIYEPLATRLLGNINLNFEDENKIKEIIKTLKLKDEDFNDKDKEAMIKFIQDIFNIKYNDNLNVCDINNLIINNDMRDVELNVDVFITVLSNFTKDDFEENIINEGIENIKKRFLNRLNDIKSSVPIPRLNKPIKPNNASNHELRNYEEDMKKYNLDCIRFTTKKQLYKLGLLISQASEKDKSNIKWAINIILEQLVCHVGTLDAINYAVKCLMQQDDNNDLRDALSNEIMQFRINLIEEVARKHLHNKIVCISELGKSKAEYSNHMKAYLVMDLSRDLKVTGLYENEFRYEYDKSFVINEVNKLYKEGLLQEVVELIRNDAKLSNMVRDYLERSIFRTSDYLMIEDFIHDEEYKIKEDAIKALLVHFGYLK